MELIDQVKDQYEMDLYQLDDPSKDEDYDLKYKKFNEKAIQKATELTRSGPYREIFALPAFTLALVMASRVNSHYTHASWFRVSSLAKMLEIHGTVSEYSPCSLHFLMPDRPSSSPSSWS